MCREPGVEVTEANGKALAEKGTNLEPLNTWHQLPAPSPEGTPQAELESHFLETRGCWVHEPWEKSGVTV